MSFMFKTAARSLARLVTMWLSVKNCWHDNKWSSISFWHWQCASDRYFSFTRFVGLFNTKFMIYTQFLARKFYYCYNLLSAIECWGARWSSGQCAQRLNAKAKQRSYRSAMGWVTKIYYLELLRASESTLSCWSRLHLQSLASTPVSRRVDVRQAAGK
jgi:hypothetical protein